MSRTRPVGLSLLLSSAMAACGALTAQAADPSNALPSPRSEVGDAGFFLVGGVLLTLVVVVAGLVLVPLLVGYVTYAGLQSVRPSAAVRAGPMMFWACAAAWCLALPLSFGLRFVSAGWALLLLDVVAPVAGAAWSYRRQGQRLGKT